jgi:parallel beta-helix repeat protein
MLARPRLALLLVSAFLSAPAALAQTALSGNVFDGAGGPLLAGQTYTIAASIAVPAGQTLTIQPGAILRFFSGTSTFTILGTLDARGSASQKIVFTEDNDTTVLGGSTPGNPGAWRGLAFGADSDASVLEHCQIRFGGSGTGSNIVLDAADIVLRECDVTGSAYRGIDLSGTSSPTLEDCTITSCASDALALVPFTALGGFSNCTVSGNGGNFARISNGTLATSLTLAPTNLPGGVIVGAVAFVVPAGLTLTLEPGVVFKATSGTTAFNVSGTLLAQGTAAEPIVFTSVADDSVAGDTNNNGPSSGAPGHWRGLRFDATSGASVLENTEVRFAGSGTSGSIILDGADIVMRDCSIDSSAYRGLDLSGTARPTAVRLSVTNCNSVAIQNAEIDAVPGFSSCTLAGNAGNYLSVTDGLLETDVSLEEANIPGGALVHQTITIPAGRTLTLGRGVVFKAASGTTSVASAGRLVTRGTLARPVVFTSTTDDAHGGDTNNNGPSTGGPGGWRGLAFTATDEGSNLRGALVRFAGSGTGPAINCDGPLVTLEHVRVDRSGYLGFDLSALASARFLTAWDCNSDGFLLRAGSFTLEHATSVGNGDDGFDSESGSSATVTSSIAWGNTTNYEGFVAAELAWSNGNAALAGSSGNIDLDPLFVDEVAGDLRLLPGSPCIDTGDPLLALDADGTRTDMGSHPFNSGGAPTTYCTAKLNSLGCLPAIDSWGFASLSSPHAFDIQVHYVRNNELGIFYYGYLPGSAPFQGGTRCVSSPKLRTPVLNSGGAATGIDCSGVFHFDMNARIQSGVDGNLAVGTVVYGQFWMRDSGSPSGTGLSDGIQFTVQP